MEEDIDEYEIINQLVTNRCMLEDIKLKIEHELSRKEVVIHVIDLSDTYMKEIVKLIDERIDVLDSQIELLESEVEEYE